MASDPPHPPGDGEAARLAAALRLLAAEPRENAEPIASWIRAQLRGPRRDTAFEGLAAAWDAPDPSVRRWARRLSAEALVEEASERLGRPPDPFAEGRIRMVRDQLLPQGIDDPRVVRALLDTPRELFIPEAERDRAYGPHPVSIGQGQTISQPFIVAYMTQALALRGPERVLEIGTGSGYQTAILARLAREVYTIEVIPALSERASALLDRLGLTAVRRRVGDGRAGWPEAAPFDAVLVTCAPADVPPRLADQLRDGGRLVIPVGDTPDAQQLIRLTRDGDRLREEKLLNVRFVPMVGGTGEGRN
jgi:protein-L-isoaspartate(D-aspartate) O-methyltransferase